LMQSSQLTKHWKAFGNDDSSKRFLLQTPQQSWALCLECRQQSCSSDYLSCNLAHVSGLNDGIAAEHQEADDKHYQEGHTNGQHDTMLGTATHHP